MFVGTVHSFCSRLLRQYPVQAGISPGFVELEEPDDLLLQRKMLRRALEQPEGRRLLRLLSEFDATPADLLKALQVMSDHGELDYAVRPTERPDLTAAWQAVDLFADYFQEVLPEWDEPEPTCKLLVLGPSLLRRRQSAHREAPRDLLKLLEEWETEPKPVKRYWGASRAEQSANLDPVLERVQQFRQQQVGVQLRLWRSYLYGQCVPFLLEVRRACQAERQLSGAVNFNDLLRITCDLVRQNPEVRSSLQKRLKHLCVDEFQDTDPLQAELFFLLSSSDLEERDWTRVQPRPASLFLVGDPKQSIYRFRRADIETYNTVRRRMQESGGEVLSLLTSFRSTPPMCQWINQVFTSLLPAQSTPQQARFQALGSRGGDHSPPPVGRLVQQVRGPWDVSALEAQQIAALIQSRLAEGYAGSDFLILTARKAQLLHYQQALLEAGIACQVSADPAPLSPAGRGLLRLLQVLANSQDKIALVGVLRGSLFGHSDEELFQHFQGQQAPLVAQTLALLDQLRSDIRSLPLGAAAKVVTQKLGLAPTPEIEGIVDYLGERGQSGLTLTQATRELFEEGAVPIPPSRGGQNGVRVMNLHKAKGLEARVVFLAAPTSGLPLRAEHTVIRSQGRQGGALCLYRNRKPLAHPENWDELEQAELTYLQAEHTRLLYVAATRAKEELIVGQWTGSYASVSQPWAALSPFLEDHPILEPQSALLPAPPSPQAPVHFPSPEPCLAPSWRHSSVTANNQSQGLQSLSPPEGFSVGGAAWGDLIHRLLEQLVKRPELEREQLRRLARWFSFEAPDLDDHLEAALNTLEAIRQSPFWQRVLAARERLVEVPFGERVDRQLLFGTIDLALEQEQGWDIIDYKTDRKSLQDLIATYAGQVSQYAQSWTDITRQEVGFAGLYGVRERQLSDDLRGDTGGE
jgi:ATP-dependent helicase/nuclease subunit A